MREVALTSIDNPWNYFDQFEEWIKHDLANRNCCSTIARIADFDDEGLTDEEERELREAAIDRFLEHDLENVYVKVTKDVDEETLVQPENSDINEEETIK